MGPFLRHSVYHSGDPAKVLAYQRFGPRLNLINSLHSDILPTRSLNFAGGRVSKSAKFWLDFRHQSHLTLCGFKTEQRVRNLILTA